MTNHYIDSPLTFSLLSVGLSPSYLCSIVFYIFFLLMAPFPFWVHDSLQSGYHRFAVSSLSVSYQVTSSLLLSFPTCDVLPPLTFQAYNFNLRDSDCTTSRSLLNLFFLNFSGLYNFNLRVSVQTLPS